MVRDDLEKAQGLPVYGRCCGASPSAICPHRTYKVRRRVLRTRLTSRSKAVQQDKLKALPMRMFTDKLGVVGPVVAVPKDLPHYGPD